MYNEYILLSMVLHLLCVCCKKKMRSPFFSPQGAGGNGTRQNLEKSVGKRKGSALFGGLAQGPQRIDVRLAFLYNISVDDRRAEVEFELAKKNNV
jgi:hypothetical protein